ncbi:MAG TPA: VWA domain-containing protein [Candidatus Aquilonibacter sp.]|jgi:VWFA-related protein|nr:VWA domain-containing protein [Candidatus Aquilonibacter sp.]
MTVLEKEQKVGLSNKTARHNHSFTLVGWLTAVIAVACLFGYLSVSTPSIFAQNGTSQTQPSTPAQNQTTQSPAQSQDIPDAPSVQPSAAPPPEPPQPAPKPEEKKAAPNLNPWTNQPNSNSFPADATPPSSDDTAPPPPMPPVRTLPPGTTKKTDSQEDIYTLVVHTNFVQLPVTVKDRDGRMVDGLLPTDFVVKENGVVQKLSYFSADPFALSVAIVLDLGMPDVDVQKVNRTFSALVGAFAPYDEVSVYTYSSTVTQVSDFMGANQKLTALLNQMKTERGHNNGVPVMSGPLAPNGPIINGMPVGSPTQPVYTPPKESHVLNDAILRAALDLRKRNRARRKIIFVISDGREYGSEASYRDVLKMLLSNEIQVRAIAVDSAALPVYGKIERLHLPKEGYGDILPKYVSATGGAPIYKELTRNAIEDIYGQAMSEARNQYTLGYSPIKPKTPTSAPYHSIEVLVDRPGLKIYAKDGYYPAIAR